MSKPFNSFFQTIGLVGAVGKTYNEPKNKEAPANKQDLRKFFMRLIIQGNKV